MPLVSKSLMKAEQSKLVFDRPAALKGFTHILFSQSVKTFTGGALPSLTEYNPDDVILVSLGLPWLGFGDYKFFTKCDKLEEFEIWECLPAKKEDMLSS